MKIQNFSVTAKLFLILIFPILTVLGLALNRVMIDIGNFSIAKQVEITVSQSVRISKLIGTLQAERGASGVVLASKGTRFRERLTELRSNTDDAIYKIKNGSLSTRLTSEDEIRELRVRIDSLSLDSSDSARRYTKIISDLISMGHQAEQKLENLELSRRLGTLNRLIETKERAGRERAILGIVFSQRRLTEKTFPAFVNNLGAYQAYSQSMYEALSDEQKKHWDKMQLLPEFKAVAKIQQQVFSKTSFDVLSIDDAAWFELATARIDKLAEFEIELSNELLQEALVLKNSAFYQLMLVSTLLISLATFTALITKTLIRSMTNAVMTIEQALSRLASGDLTINPASLSLKAGRDEFGKILRATCSLVNQLHKMIGDLSSASAQLASAAEESSVVTIQTFKGIQRQQEDTKLAATAMCQMSTAVSEVAMSTVEAAELSNAVKSYAEHGQHNLQDTITLIGDLTQDISSTASVIESLKTKSTEITAVLDVINSIAEQTNLLALNAAIEAARAGDFGRGFAVVADEVRALASRTTASTKDIQQMIYALQSSVQQACDSIIQSQQKAKAGNERIEIVGETLSGMLPLISSINEKNTQIASAAEQQAVVAADINTKISSINTVGEDTGEAAKQNAANSEQLAALAEQLNAAVAKFQLN